MRAGGAVCLALLLIAIPAVKVFAADDIYLEDQDGDKDEFLEVKEEGELSHFTRIKRGLGDWWFPFSPTTTTAAPENLESITEDQDDTQDNNDYDSHSDGSGAVPVPKFDPDPSEKTLRVSFVVMEPFLDDYSNRDSELFQTFSHNLADAVNKLFEDQPGTQKASLVRIQSRPADNFSCKVTLDIVTTADNTDRMADKLRVHIRNTRTLGDYTLTDADFSANVVMPGSSFELCRSDELECSDGRCFPGSARCDGATDCYDGADERDCPVDETNEQTDQNPDDTNQVDTSRPRCEKEIPCPRSVDITICPEDFCNGIENCPDGEDESQDRCESTPSPGRGLETLRVSFVVMEPFLDDYSNRDSELYQTFSHNLAEAVNKLFEDEPGTQKASLVRIQSRPADNFSCKVTLDIVTTAENTDRMADKLRVHIRNTRTLGDYTLTDADFSANVVMPDRGDQSLSNNFDTETTTNLPWNEETSRARADVDETACLPGEFRCDETRCILKHKVCDQEADCSDGTDESTCPPSSSSRSSI